MHRFRLHSFIHSVDKKPLHMMKRATARFITSQRRVLAVWTVLVLVLGGIAGVILVQANGGKVNADANCAPQIATSAASGSQNDTVGAMGAGMDSPYGVTTIHADSKLIDEFRQLNICWVRLQIDETTIQPAPGVFDWSTLDQDVAILNAAGIHIDLPLRCFGGSCFSSPTLPTPQQMAAYATAVASRYDGQHGHGRIDAIEIGNEEPDFFPPAVYGPILQAGYLAIKAVNPNILVGMYGTFRPNLRHIAAVMSAIANGYSQYLDFANFHYYAHGKDPSISTGDHPSLSAEIQTIHQILPEKPIWLTEVGWPTAPLPGMQVVSPQVQAQYLRYVMDTAASSSIVQRVFWFTLDYGNQPDAIDSAGAGPGPSPAFTAFQQYVQQRPGWTNSGVPIGSTGSPTGTPASDQFSPTAITGTPVPVVPPPQPTTPVPVASPPQPTTTPIPVVSPPTATLTPTDTPSSAGTPTPVPTGTPAPVPTDTPVPADTPTPTPTPPPMWPMP
jgi:hypothetical protein